MTLEKRLEEIPDEVANEDLDELRRALIRTQKQLKDARQRQAPRLSRVMRDRQRGHEYFGVDQGEQKNRRQVHVVEV